MYKRQPYCIVLYCIDSKELHLANAPVVSVVALRCESPKPLLKGRYELSPFNTFGAKLHYTCNDGFTLIGLSENVCQCGGFTLIGLSVTVCQGN